jgi:type II secretory ATPase GspE/PulE/Tfp pilus assembly ATPase PilB-like protein
VNRQWIDLAMATDSIEKIDAEDGDASTLAEVLSKLKSRFTDELSGARQATRSQLVRFLARALKLTEERADRLFENLSSLGAIGRMNHAEWHDDDGRVAHGWAICDDVISRADLHDVELIEKATHSEEPREEYAAAEDLLRRAISARATDIHLDPFEDEVEVRFRIDGRLEHYCRLSDLVAAKIIAQLKLMGELDVAEPFQPQEGHLTLPLDFNDFAGRLTIVPTVAGDAVAVRLLHRDRLMRPLDVLGFTSGQRSTIERLLTCNEGIVLVAGPTGSGKTTTLYSLLYALDDGHRSIVTIEDPVEFRTPSFLQIELDPRHGITTASALKSVLRMDPDIVMLGEIRDEEAAAIAMRAADSGTYVFCTLHARDAAAAITAMRDQQVDAISLAGNLRAIISQRLVRRLCERCTRRSPITEKERSAFMEAKLTPSDELAQKTGCPHCGGSGFFERIGLFEVVENSLELAEAIKNGASENEIRQILSRFDVPSHRVDGLIKVKQGLTSLAELDRVCTGRQRNELAQQVR